MVVIRRGDIVTVFGEGNGFEGLGEELGAKLAREVVERIAPASRVDKRHGAKDLSHVNPPAPRSKWDPVGQEPALVSMSLQLFTISVTYQSSGGTGLTTSHSTTPSTAIQNFAQCGALNAPPNFQSVLLAFRIRSSSASTPRILNAV